MRSLFSLGDGCETKCAIVQEPWCRPTATCEEHRGERDGSDLHGRVPASAGAHVRVDDLLARVLGVPADLETRRVYADALRAAIAQARRVFDAHVV
jgi:hypothetical protein